MIIPQETKGFSQIQADYAYYNSIRERLLKEIVMLAIDLVLIVGLLFYLRKVHMFSGLAETAPMNWLHRIPLDVRLLMIVIAWFICKSHLYANSLFRWPLEFRRLIDWVILSLALTVIWLVVLNLVKLCRRKEQLEDQWKNSVFKRISSQIASHLVKKPWFLRPC
ncbi:hypothetical protein [Paenibacillus sp. N3.4]|uniref:hypothetical protein n=1 Tax=Paenibacillus sp. N3.4 TaxID=2603222 RepID=UPI0011C7A134|nr:hypothetical protein [Paenibacillus sp. N3.4]TXK85073.1 hypothetical protein FU659_06150 [Paenibacillus sp. N3.4]